MLICSRTQIWGESLFLVSFSGWLSAWCLTPPSGTSPISTSTSTCPSWLPPWWSSLLTSCLLLGLTGWEGAGHPSSLWLAVLPLCWLVPGSQVVIIIQTAYIWLHDNSKTRHFDDLKANSLTLIFVIVKCWVTSWGWAVPSSAQLKLGSRYKLAWTDNSASCDWS